MGVGGSTSRPNSAKVMSAKRPQTSSSTSEHFHHRTHRNSSRPGSSLPDRPTESCCSHYKENHAGLTRTVSPASHVTTMKDDSIDDEIEEIVANTLDIVSNHRTSRPPSQRDGRSSRTVRQDVPSSAVSNSGVRRILRSGSSRRMQKRQSVEDLDVQYDAKDAIPEVDFAKFKKVNHQGATMQNNGRIIHRQESDLLWRLGLISPEAYTITGGSRAPDSCPRITRSRSAPNNQGLYMKTPSYDLTEEQLMANIEKEFECTI